jgi:hypothetical protein
MGNLSNLRGAAGEYFCGRELLRPVQTRGMLFDIVRFEGREPTADFMVFLVNPLGERTGPFFFLQIKSTTKSRRCNGSYAYSFDRNHVRRAQALKVPFFVCIVDFSACSSGEIFVMGVDSKRSQGIYRMPCAYDLSAQWVKLAMFDEVTRIWAAQDYPYFNQLT